MLACTDIAFLTLDDEDALWGEKPVDEVIARTHAAGVQEVVVKRGADSCPVAIAGQPLLDVPAVKLAKECVVDTTAAGDSFSAGYLAVRLTGGDAESAARRGHLTASTVIQYRGRLSRATRCRSSPCRAIAPPFANIYPARAAFSGATIGAVCICSPGRGLPRRLGTSRSRNADRR